MGLSTLNGSMKNYSQSVYDFVGEEEEEPFKITQGRRFLMKEKSKKKPKMLPPLSTTDVTTKYSFLQYFWRGAKKEAIRVSEPLHVDDNDDDNDNTVKDRISASNPAIQSSSSHYRSETCPSPNFPDSRTVCSESDVNSVKVLDNVTGRNHIDSTTPHFLPDNEPVCINLDDETDNQLSSQISSSDLADSAGPSREQGLEHGAIECDIEPIVVIYPTHVIYGEKFYVKPQMTFSCSSIKLDVSAVNGITEPFVLEWKTADLIRIESMWCERLKTASVSLYLKSKDEKVVDDAKSSGIVEIKFCVSDPQWSKKEEAIKLLDVRYIDKWDVDLNFNASFEDVIYPEGDPDSVSISKRDIELLQPERFINDTIVDFYIMYLKNKVKPEDNHRFHFFNSFFFRKMADFDSNSSRACKGSEAFQRVRKWTKKVNIFQKDYIFVPVNFSLHWSLIIICHPGEVAVFSGEETEKSVKVPCILHADSIKGSHRGLKNLIQSYLLEEWKERSTNSAEDVSSKFLNLRFLPLELPQQQNSFDCGLFLLHYMELFVEQAPVNFNPFRLSNASRFLKKDWFPPTAASLKRGHIKKIIIEIAEYSSHKVPSSVSHENCSPDITDLKEQVIEEEHLQEAYNSNDMCQESSCHNALQSIILTPVAAKPLRSVYIGGPEFAGFRNRRFDEGLPVDENTQLFGKTALGNQVTNVMSPIEEGEETLYPTPCSLEEEDSGLQLALITEPSVKSITKKDAHWSFDMLSESEESEDGGQIVRTNTGKHPISSEEHEKENYALALCESSPENADVVYECSSTSSGELEACVIEDSQEENGRSDARVSQISRCRRRLFDPTNQKHSSFSEDNIPANHKSPAVPCVVEDSQEEIEKHCVRDAENYRPRGRLFDSSNQKAYSSIVEPLSKRARLMPPRTEKKVTTSLSKGIQEIVIL